MVATNPSLNACIDRKHFQTKVNKIKKYKIEQMEFEIAEDIIKDFKEEKEE